ncbi:MAG: DNA repair protein RecO [Fimbriimonadaceae bacterium]|nr:DNA repair protein RecO [Fimbriimonadaceae bacterium]
MSATANVHAIVLRRRDAGESDRRLTLLTAELGVMDVTAKGARKHGSRLAGISEPLSVCSMNLATGRKTWFVTQAQPITSYPGLRADYDRLTFALALTEIAAAVLPHGQEAPEAFRFLVEALRYIEVAERPIVSLIWAELKLMELSGFQPVWNLSVVSGVGVQEAQAFVSPSAGGYVTSDEASEFRDRFLVRAEVLYGLAKVAEIEEPPPKLKYAEDSLRALFSFWRHFAESALQANEQVIANLPTNGV